MLWFLLSLSSALSKSLADTVSKKILDKVDEISIGCASRGLIAIMALFAVAFQGIPEIGPAFMKALIISGIINIFATILLLKSLKHGEFSLVAPMLALSPVFLLLTSPIITKEMPNFWGIIGILISVGGIYTLGLSGKKTGILAPLKAVWNSKGVKSALFVSFLFSISANYDSIATKNSSPFFYILSVNTFIFLGMLFWAARKKGFFNSIINNFKGLSLVSLFMMGESSFQFMAMEMAIVPYVISVKRTSALFSVFWGKIFFKESEFKERIIGSLLIVAGLIIIKLLG